MMGSRLFRQDVGATLRSRRALVAGMSQGGSRTLEGGCGVIGIVGTRPLKGRHIIRSCEQMHNRGNSKGGGLAAAGLFGDYRRHYALHVAYLEDSARSEVETDHVQPVFDIEQAETLETLPDHREVGLEVRPPSVTRYFVRVKPGILERFASRHALSDPGGAEDEFVFQNSFRLNQRFYVQAKPPRAFVLSHGRDLMILKGVGYAEQIARYYQVEDLPAHIWIGHQRYPTRGRVWHPGGAHPFAGLHEALVHNGDFANYHAVTEYLLQRGTVPLFVTDTEVAALLFDLYSRVLRYPLEFVIEALAPTPEGDFDRLSKKRQRIYRALQSAHLHGSPDGPWFFIVARTDPDTGAPQLIGITDVSMLRPQVFALQVDEIGLGAIASEKQAIDAFFEEVARLHPNVPTVADRYWNARGGSCTDGGAFVYTVLSRENRMVLDVRDKFGHPIAPSQGPTPYRSEEDTGPSLAKAFDVRPVRLHQAEPKPPAMPELSSTEVEPSRFLDRTDEIARPLPSAQATRESIFWGGLPPRREAQAAVTLLMKDLQEGCFARFVTGVAKIPSEVGPGGWRVIVDALSYLRDRRWDPGCQRRSILVSEIDRALNNVLDRIGGPDETGEHEALRLDLPWYEQHDVPCPQGSATRLVVDARGFPPEGSSCVSRLLVRANQRGWRRFLVYGCRGDRFMGCGLGPDTSDVRLDIYGCSGDYLGSGLDGAHIYVHGDAQDQVGQILKSGRIVVYGDVGQTFLYGAKGGEAFVLGSAAGRPLINAVGHIRAVINGSCLDYCAESFMAGDQVGGGFAIINGLDFDHRGEVIGLEVKYPGNNLFSLASGGACYLNDPYLTVSETQLNGASFVPLARADWGIIYPYLKENEALFGISIRHDLLMVDGVLKWPKEVFRKIVASTEVKTLDWSSLPD